MYSTKPLRQYTQEEKLKSFSVTLRNITSTSIVFFFFFAYIWVVFFRYHKKNKSLLCAKPQSFTERCVADKIEE